MTTCVILILIGSVVVLAPESETGFENVTDTGFENVTETGSENITETGSENVTEGGQDSQPIETGSENLTEEEYDPEINPEDFVEEIDNPYFPLIPGTTFVYEGESEEEDTTILDKVFVTNETKVILGVTTTVVQDTEYEDGELIEETFDWYAQDEAGNVWYFGENSIKYADGESASTEGSWEAGVNGSKPGIIMSGDPKVGDVYYQEFSPGEAEDQAEVLSLNEMVTVAYGSFENCLKTGEWNLLEPGEEENKYYAPGVGLLLEEEVEGGDEKLELVEITTE